MARLGSPNRRRPRRAHPHAGDIATLAEGMWQRALKLAGEAATHDDNAAGERLRQLQLENDIKQRSLELREQEIDTQARERERALADARDHLLSLSKALSREQATNQAQERRIADLETQVAQYRQQIGALIACAIAKTTPKPRRSTPSLARSAKAARTSSRSKKPGRTEPVTRRKTAATSRPSRKKSHDSKRNNHRRKPPSQTRRQIPDTEHNIRRSVRQSARRSDFWEV